MEDFHVHTNYSDGTVIDEMVDAAEAAGLDGVGFVDHCNLTTDPAARRERAKWGRNFDRTYDRRRSYLTAVREQTDLRVYDAVEVDYEPTPETEAAIEEFLAGARFDYAVGSVHYVGEREVFPRQTFDTQEERAAFVDDYYEAMASLVESELFDVLAHADLIEAHPRLQGIAGREHHERLADALSGSRTVPELNAGHVGREGGDYDGFHPGEDLFAVLLERGIDFTVGTDSHESGDFSSRVPALRDVLEDRGIAYVSPV
jgi:histidinol-phosphatase (PHP family)